MPLSADRFRRLISAGQDQFLRRLAATDRQSAERLRIAYERNVSATRRLLTDLRREAAKTGMGTADLARLPLLQTLRDTFRDGLNRMTITLDREARRATANGAGAGREYAGASLRAVGVTANGFAQPSVETLRAMIPYVDSKAFQDYLARFGKNNADYLGNLILVNASRGISPLQTASQISRYVDNYPLHQARATVRTLQLWSARAGTMAIYRANSDIVTGWIWSADLGPNTCMSCVAMHGTFHGLDEILNDHWNGRCAPVPVTSTRADLGFSSGQEVMTGIDWFMGLSDEQQRDMMGPGMHDAWSAKLFGLTDIPKVTYDPIYGAMRGASPLKELVPSG